MTNFLYENDLPNDFVVKSNLLAIDTEAMGLNNKRDRLCLVQLSFGDGDAYLVKFSAGSNYLAPNLKRLLSDKNIIKILHFARFDMAIIKHYLGIVIEPVYCTKIASKIARTYTDKHSFKELCAELLDIKISKLCQSSDWGSATLSQEQIDYAASDVLYLHQLKSKLDNMLIREKRFDLVNNICAFLPTRIELDLLGWQNVDVFSHD